jgi:hypothetical protein
METTPKKRPRPPGGSRKGCPNKTTAALKEAILLAAEDVGENGKGKGKLRGYLRHVAQTDTKAFCAMLGKIIPLQLAGDPGQPIVVTLSSTDAAL